MTGIDAAAAAPLVVRRRRARPHGSTKHGGAWKVAYADFVTAMMAFFMLLWLMSNPDKGRLKGLAEYFSTATVAAAPTTMTMDPGSDPGTGGRRRQAQGDARRAVGVPSSEAGRRGAARGGTANIADAAQRVLANDMRIALERPIEGGGAAADVRVDPTRDGMRITLLDTADQSIFAGPTAQLNGYGRALLTRVARQLGSGGARIAIEGHTDARGGADSDRNWALSGDRALAARHALIAAGLPADHFAEVVAKGGTEPVYPDRPDRPENRRIAIVVLSEPSTAPHDVGFVF